MEYVIVGDTKEYKNCLIYVCGKSQENAEKILEGILNNPTENDKLVTKGHTNLRIEKVEDSECWWNDLRD
jgi:hypothetical protein